MIDDIITLYTTYTGKVVTEANRPQYEAWARRAVSELESILGWSLSGESNVNVLGISASGCDCNIENVKLLDPPTQFGTYRFFSFDDKKPFLHTDPFKKVHSAYICRVVPEKQILSSESDSDNINVTILKTIKDYTPRYTNPKFGKFLKACREMTVCQSLCERSCTECTAILVDADWVTFKDIKDMIGVLICDYIDWLASDGPSTKGLQSESVDGHSVSYRDYKYILPYQNPSDAAIIQTLVGPYGMMDTKRIW